MSEEMTFQNGPVDGDLLWKRMYLPPGRWHRFAEDEGTTPEGPGWHTLGAADVPAIVLVRDGTSLRLADPARHTSELDWDGAREWRPS